ERRIGLGWGGFPFLDEGPVGRIALGGVGRAWKFHPAVLVARGRGLRPENRSEHEGRDQSRSRPDAHAVSRSFDVQTQRRRLHIAWNVGHSRALEKQKHCEDREIDSTWCGVDTGYRG